MANERSCFNCKYSVKEPNEEPCNNCRSNYPWGTPEYESHEHLWESREADAVHHPSHYTQGDIQCIDAMESAFGKEAVAVWCKLNAFKYIWREEHKNGIQDLDKAMWYLKKYKVLTTEDAE